MPRVMCTHCCYDHWSVFICIQHADIICMAAATSYILLLIPIFHQYWKYCSQMAGLGQLVRRLDLFCVRGRRGSRERRVVAESPAHTHKVTPHSAHGCKISNIHGMASCHTPDRSITRMRASLVCAQPRVAIDPRAERAISRIGVPGPRSGSETWSEGVYRVIGANRHQLLSRYKD